MLNYGPTNQGAFLKINARKPATIGTMSEQKTKPVSEREILGFFLELTLEHKRDLALSCLIPIGMLGLGTLLPFYTGKLLAALSVDVSHAASYLPYIVAAGVLGALAHRQGVIYLFRLQAQVMAKLNMRILDNLLSQSASFHNNRVAGKLVSDAIDFPQAFLSLSSATMLNAIPITFTLVVGVALVSAQSWQLGLILLGMAVATVGTALRQSHTRRPLRQRRQVATKAVTAHFADTIVNNQTVKTFAREEHEMATHRELNDSLFEIRFNDWASNARAGNNRILGLLCFQVLFAFAIIHLVKADPALLGVGIFAFSYSVSLSSNLFRINDVIRQIEDSLVAADPMMEVLKKTPAILDKPGSPKLVINRGAIAFDDVTFGYKDSSSQEAVFNHLNLTVKAGEKIGLVGPSGGGKSTFTRLLLRFNDIQSGAITIDNQNIAAVQQASLRETIAYVPQEPLMFHRSVADNIAYGMAGCTETDIIAAAKKANAHEFITQLPEGYETLVGERGVKLSGGQRQRVAIARAILKDAPILVLDEATSALDSQSEALIQEALWKLMRGRTTIVVAHRLSTIQKMDRILVLEDGKVTEQGSHKELLTQKGTYAQLWGHQSGGFLED
jgi:ATP-binding cassette subfamily B protein